jgi:hypothetical protein
MLALLNRLVDSAPSSKVKVTSIAPGPFSQVIEISFDSQKHVMALARTRPLKGKEQLESLGVVMLIYDVRDA